MPKPRCDAHAKKLLRNYVTLRRQYEQRMRCRIFKLRRQFQLTKLLTSKAPKSLSSLSSLSSNTYSSEATSSDGSWADILGPDWRGRGMIGSVTSSGLLQTSVISQNFFRLEMGRILTLPAHRGTVVMPNQILTATLKIEHTRLIRVPIRLIFLSVTAVLSQLGNLFPSALGFWCLFGFGGLRVRSSLLRSFGFDRGLSGTAGKLLFCSFWAFSGHQG